MLAGCGESVGNVSGHVTYQGKPLPVGKIAFFCEGGDKPYDRAIRDGIYSIARVPLGDAGIAIITFPTTPVSGPGGLKSPESFTDIASLPSGRYVPIPAKYHSVITSGLKITVKQGDNPPFDFDLQ